MLAALKQHGANSRRGDGCDRLLKTPFIEWCKSLRIKTVGGLQPFELFEWQESFAHVLLENPRTPITLLSSRQTGKTALVLALLVWLALSRSQFTAVLVHRKGEDSRQLARRAKKFIPDGTRLESDSLSLIEFAESGSQLHFRSCNPRNEDGAESTGRGLNSVDLAVIEEASHTSNVQEIMTVLGPTLTWSSMATVLQIGTAGKRESYYYQGLAQAYGGKEPLEQTLEGIRAGIIAPYQVERSAGRIAVITNWRAIPQFAAEGIDPKTKRPNYLTRIQKEQDLTDGQVDSEHELIFDSDTTLSVFEFPLVMAARRGEWEPPDESAVYYAGVDGSGKPKPGRKGDYTVCLILKKESPEDYRVVKLYRKRGITFERRYAEISEILNAYGPVATFVEANDGMGQSYHEALLSGSPGLQIDRFNNTKERKASIVNKIDLALERGQLGIPKGPVIDELLSFQQLEDGSMGAVGKDAHDDTTMALGLALAAARYGGIQK
ncbi:terminase large subunit domain-containing protein [Nodosilinea sp. AN01ver1]